MEAVVSGKPLRLTPDGRDELIAAGARPERRSSMFVRSDIEVAAESFIKAALDSLGLIWEPHDVEAEAADLTDRAFRWRDE
jgi:hypothetical protein